MDMVEFWTFSSANGIILDAEMRDNISRYVDELTYWNEKVNMISRKDMDNILERHILHSLSILKYIDIPQKAYVLDIGTGGGFPGIPVKIARPDLRMTLIDSISKKAKMTEMFADHTGLHNLKVVKERAEIFSEKNRNKFDKVIARAVAPSEKLITWSMPAIKKSGSWHFLKGGDLEEEINDVKKKYPNLKYNVRELDLIGFDWFKENDKKLISFEF